MPAPGDPDGAGTADSPEAAARGGKAKKWLKNSGIDIIIPRRAGKHGPALSVQDPAADPRQSGRAEIRPGISARGLSPSAGGRGPDFPRLGGRSHSGAGSPAAPSSPFFRLRRNTPPLNFTGFIQSAAGKRQPSAGCHGPVSEGNLRHDYHFCRKILSFHTEPGREVRTASSAAPRRCRSSPRAGPHITPAPLPRMGGSVRQPFPCCAEEPGTV